MRTWLPILSALALTACGDKASDSGSGTFDPAEFTSGSFTMTSNATDDACLDGVFSLLFMPDSTATDWQYPVELPAWADLPASYSVQLQDPFAEMPVTVAAGSSAGLMHISGASQSGVEFNAESYPGCMVDMSIDVDITIDTNDAVSGQATFQISGLEDQPSECPQPIDTCGPVTLDFTGVRN